MNPYTFLTRRGTWRSMTQRWLVIVGVLWFSTVSTPGPIMAQGTQPQRGPRNIDPRWHALLHARVIPEPGRVIEDATLVVRDGVIQWVTAGGTPPPGARVWDYSGKTVVAGFIEPHLTVDTPPPPAEAQGNHWNHAMVTPQRSALDGDGVTAEVREQLRQLGFTTAAISPRGGMFRGTSALVALGDGTTEVADRSAEIIERNLYQEVELARARFSWSAEGRNAAAYPTSSMGSVALMRQTFSDADWYSQCQDVYRRNPDAHEPPTFSAALAELGPNGEAGARLLFDCSSELELLRCARIAEEFHRKALYLGSGLEFRRLDAIATMGPAGAAPRIIVPLNFPSAPTVDSEDAAQGVSLRDLLTWEQGPANLARLHAKGLELALTTERLEDRKSFHANLREAMHHGVHADQALAMLTVAPARMLGVEGRLGRVTAGHLAHLVVFDGTPFSADAEVRDVWVGGRRYAIKTDADKSHTGTWDLSFDLDSGAVALKLEVDDSHVNVTVAGESIDEPGADSGGDSDDDSAEESDEESDDESDDEPGRKSTRGRALKAQSGRFSFLVDGATFGKEGVFAFSAIADGDHLFGTVQGPSGQAIRWTGSRGEPSKANDVDGSLDEVSQQPPRGRRGRRGGGGRGPRAGSTGGDSAETPRDIPECQLTPLGAFGLNEAPRPQNLIIRAQTLWTCGPDGNIDNGVLVVEDGQIRYAGPAEGAPTATRLGDDFVTIEAEHVTPGLIDCHSHTGVSGGVNEVGQRVTAEVRIGDMIDPDDVNWYRQLAGGLTAANQLHGSANAIGGQNSVVKLRWGAAHPDAMKFVGAPPGIKFALGENPKRVAQNTGIPDEYPQTRMGVATLIRDRLQAGEEYDAEWERYNTLLDSERRATMPPRRDLELEAMGEIVRGERWVHCHSYRQDEILMLCRVAEDFGFKIGTFQHVLEGYKIAEAIKEAAVGGSTFADWWAYKFEVIDAIPHNAALMSEVGVVTSINSDSNEHARRLNTEAAKAIKYGGMSPEEALKLVTLNPAIQLGVDDRVGSLEVGKDGDFVIWSDNPLSYYARCQNTFIEGREYYSDALDARLRKEALAERNRLIQQLLAEKKRGGDDKGEKETVTVGDRPPLHPLFRRRLEIEDALYRAGVDPSNPRPGDCGCEGY